MSRGFPIVRLGEAITRVERPEQPVPGKAYRQIGVKLWGKGAYERDPLDGAQTRYRTLWRVETADIILNKIWARNGSVAVVPESLAGCYGSNEFPTFATIREKLEPRWFHWLTKTRMFWKQCDEKSRGTSGKNRIRPERFLEIEIPLPPISEQRRIVACLEPVSRKIEEACAIRATAGAQTTVIFMAALNQVAASVPAITGDLRQVLQAAPRNGWSVRCDGTIGGTPVLTLRAVTGFRYDPRAIKRTSEPVDPDAHYWLEPGDLLITRSNTPELVGHAAIYDGRPYPCIYPDLMMRCKLRPEMADVRFVHFWLQSSIVREHIRQRAKGTSPTMKKLSQGDVEDIPFPAALTVDDQRVIVSYLDNLQMKMDVLKELQGKTAAELDALLPSVLDKAFKGELR